LKNSFQQIWNILLNIHSLLLLILSFTIYYLIIFENFNIFVENNIISVELAKVLVGGERGG
jgi:hypothetical protein